MHPPPNWSAYDQQRLANVAVSHPPRAAHHIHYNPMYVSAAPHQSHPSAAPPELQDPRIDVDDLLSFDAPEKEKNNPCPICLAPLEDEQVSTGQCLHLIHTSCLRSWLAKDSRSTCPVCLIPYEDAALNDSDPQTTAPQSATQLTSVVHQI
ncbi:hypothetical protein BWQ96_02465 [Gracilariopsis chorda]|uniref:RING-type domain-containing protein n=1 Tax=Gracilariopsis chorda TaxID=448386 RepID=A0A2V3J0E8_9FLOR|nr:hypothetical protein BWQ96_02465 [Gracilariopsis chorda]|eukprot:PXF47783.1 hypothetical protein BWQ96_02465 [Gracilariopsis chorda]